MRKKSREEVFFLSFLNYFPKVIILSVLNKTKQKNERESARIVEEKRRLAEEEKRLADEEKRQKEQAEALEKLKSTPEGKKMEEERQRKEQEWRDHDLAVRLTRELNEVFIFFYTEEKKKFFNSLHTKGCSSRP